LTGFDFNADFNAIVSANIEFGVELIPTVNSRVFSTPSVFLQIAIYHNGRRLKQSVIPTANGGDYFIFASPSISAGFDRVQFLTFTPSGRSLLQADLILLVP